MTLHDLFGEPISTYSRAQAIEDGVLVDLTPWAKETGFKFPVACTRGAWSECIEWPEGHEPSAGQSERGRAHDVLFMLLCAIRGGKSGSRCDYAVNVRGKDGRPHRRILYSICGPGDNAEPAITIMLPGED